MLTHPRLTQRQMRAHSEILEFDFEIDYLLGARNYIQDALSRRPDYKEPPLLSLQLPSLRQDSKLIMSLELNNKEQLFNRIHYSYTIDPYCLDVVQFLKSRPDPGCLVQVQQHCLVRQKYFTLEADGLLTYIRTGTLCIPDVKELKLKILQEAHGSAIGGHFGERQTISTSAQCFFWRRLWQHLKRYCRGCATCTRTKTVNHKPYGLLQPLDIPDECWRRINIDFIT
jgi:hypothetical protein